MLQGPVKLRLAVVSPFLDRSHGTELCIVEQIERLASQHGWEIQLYSQRVEDLKGLSANTAKDSGGRIFWHKVSGFPGPHLFKFIWWFFANRVRRWRDSRNPHLRPDLTYSPGINCFDADAIIVHIVFHEFYLRVRSELRLSRLPLSAWPRTLHRKLYYGLIMFLERRIYRNSRIHLAAVSRMVADQLRTHFDRADVAVIPDAVDTARFNPAARLSRRSSARNSLGHSDSEFVLLLIGNDWKKKGLDQLLRAMQLDQDLPLRLLVVGRDDPALYNALLQESGTLGHVRFLPPTPDILFVYASADAYVGPSLEDAFGLPILEAMACALPVIASARAGASEMIEDGRTGLILRQPENPEELATLLRRLFQDKSLQQELGETAAQVAQLFSWETNTTKTLNFLKETARMRLTH
jgi:UDP-glucose:(heptosyl)LPS alpha-1,3-glucosyltransferase